MRRNFTNEYEHGTNTKAVLRLIGEKWVYQVRLFRIILHYLDIT